MSELYFAGMEAPVFALRGNSAAQPTDHKVKHKWGLAPDGKEMCMWCGGTKTYHECGNPTPYCMDAPAHKVDAWKADEVLRVAAKTVKPNSADYYRYRKFWE